MTQPRYENDKEFWRSMEHVAKWEGGLANDPNDRGGLTMAGVTQDSYNRWRRANNLPLRAVSESTHEERIQIYYENYWLRGHCHQLEFPLNLVHFDSMVQHGRARHLLQEAVGAGVDGMIGPQTLDKVRSYPGGPVAAARRLLQIRLRYYARLASDEGRDDPEKVFMPGWMFRLYSTWLLVDPERV